MESNRPIAVRGKTFTGRVIKAKAADSAVVEWDRLVKVAKYDRAFRTTSKVLAHVPKDMRVRIGDHVRIGETRKLSRGKSFVIVEVMKNGKKD